VARWKSATFPKPFAALLTPRGYSHSVAKVELVETPLSWVLLTGEFAYKIKRPVQYPFIDAQSLEQRAALCQEELRLGRRFAPQLYLEVCDVAFAARKVQVGAEGRLVEHAVRMHQFERDQRLDLLLQAERIEPTELEAFGQRLADLHAEAPKPAETERWGESPQIQASVQDNLAEALKSAAVFQTEADIEALRPRLLQRLDAVKAWLAARRRAGRIRECHGDLRASNLVRLGATLTAFDCTEFGAAFRWIDIADEMALLMMDLESLGYATHANAFLGGYLGRSGDYQCCRILDMYKAHRALTRARITAVQAVACDESAREPLRQEHLRCIAAARRALTRRVPLLLVMCGFSGSGKTWLAQRLSFKLKIVHLRSDVERRRRAGLSALSRSGATSGPGIYSRQATIDLYEWLVRCAEDVLASGYGAVVDATFARRSDRARFRALAAQLGIELRLIHCHAPATLLRTRIAQRQRAATDASEADEGTLGWQLHHFDAVRAEEGMLVIEADTSSANVVNHVLNAAGKTASQILAASLDGASP
jgi:aminoglycoside phosphotransferase family enzyme/predicted kinase